MEKTQNELCLPLPQSRKPPGKYQCQLSMAAVHPSQQWHKDEAGQYRDTASSPLGGTGSKRGGLGCCGRSGWPGMDPSLTHKISMAP